MTNYDGCGLLISQMKAIKKGEAQAGKDKFPDAYLACDDSFLADVQHWFETGVQLAKNPIVLVVQKDNPHAIESLGDLADPVCKNLRVGLAHPTHSAPGQLHRPSAPAAQLKRTDVPDAKSRKAGLAPKCILRGDRNSGSIVIDGETTLSDLPEAVWDYRLGNRSALEWVLDQYGESTPRDPTIRDKFNTYRFADYKENVIALIGRVTTIAVETQRITVAMRIAPRQVAEATEATS